MPHFEKLIETDHGFMNFYFNRIFTANGLQYHVSVVGRNSKAVIFHMQDYDSNWVIKEKDSLPDYITSIEPELSNAIKDHLAKLPPESE